VNHRRGALARAKLDVLHQFVEGLKIGMSRILHVESVLTEIAARFYFPARPCTSFRQEYDGGSYVVRQSRVTN
jgi:hypothetical protein